MKKQTSAGPLVGQIFRKVAPRIGAKVVMEPVWKVVGQITFKNGKKSYFRYSSLDLNTLGASEIARDKDYAAFFMKKAGYPTVPGKAFYSREWASAIDSPEDIDAAYLYARDIGFPVIVKPNSGSQGRNVALVQERVVGKDYRVVVLDDQIISAYERIPLNVVGNGRSTIEKLLLQKQTQFTASSRDTNIRTADARIGAKLARSSLTLDSIPKRGERVYLLDNANLSSGGDAVDVTDSIHPDFRTIAIRPTKDMGLRLCGVDLMVQSDITQRPNRYWVLEINSAPGLDHYVKVGRAQKAIVENMYLEVLKGMERN